MRVFSRKRKEDYMFSQARTLIRFPENPQSRIVTLSLLAAFGVGGGFRLVGVSALLCFLLFCLFALVLHSTRRSYNVVRPLGAKRSQIGKLQYFAQMRLKTLETTALWCRKGLKMLCRGGHIAGFFALEA